MWIARNKDGALYCYPYKVAKDFRYSIWTKENGEDVDYCECCRLQPKLFPEVTWNSESKWIRFVKPEWKYIY